MKKLRVKWDHGDKAEIARRARMSASFVTQVFKGKRSVTPASADKISKAAKKTGLKISREDLLYPEESKNPLIMSEK